MRALWLHAVDRLARRLLMVADRRAPDFIVGDVERPYLRRWYLTPWSSAYRQVPEGQRTRWQRFVRSLPNVYLHQFMRDDDDRAHHDHPWPSVGLSLRGSCYEHTIAAGGVEHIRFITAGSVRYRAASFTHRLSLPWVTEGYTEEAAPIEHQAPYWTLFITGFASRCSHTGKRGDWGFHCPKFWRHYQVFTNTQDGVSVTGRGCE